MLHASKCQQIVDQIVSIARPLRILAFGSAVNGARRANDLDLLIVMPEASDCRQVLQELYIKIKRVGIPLDLIVIKASQLEEQKDAYWTVIYQALQFGVELYVA